MPLPSEELSTASFQSYAGLQVLSVMIVPDGTGDALTEAFLPDGSRVDGTIQATIVDALGYPAVGMDPEVITLASPDSRLVFCPGFDTAREATDADGSTYFDGPFGGGGTNSRGTTVRFCNLEILSPPISLWMNSPDINGDLKVNLADVQLFAADYYGAYDYRSDLQYDQVVNLSDLARFAEHVGAGCP